MSEFISIFGLIMTASVFWSFQQAMKFLIFNLITTTFFQLFIIMNQWECWKIWKEDCRLYPEWIARQEWTYYRHWRFDNSKILIDTDSKMADEVILENVKILILGVKYPQMSSEEALVA